MSLVFAGVCSHAPGITGRKERADPTVRDAFYASYDRMRQAIEDARPDALVVIGAEHFANFFMNNMPAICMGMGEHYEGPIEDEAWLGIKHARHRSNIVEHAANKAVDDFERRDVDQHALGCSRRNLCREILFQSHGETVVHVDLDSH